MSGALWLSEKAEAQRGGRKRSERSEVAAELFQRLVSEESEVVGPRKRRPYRAKPVRRGFLEPTRDVQGIGREPPRTATGPSEASEPLHRERAERAPC